MKKMAIRSKVIPCISSLFIQRFRSVDTIPSIFDQHGIDKILQQIYSENDSYRELDKEYQRFISGESSSLFLWMYVLEPGYGVSIDAHITVYHYDENIYMQQKNYLQWIYPQTSFYVGDTWWFSDEEVLNDLRQSSTIDFLIKYRAV